jgi:hypothetical protein
MRNTGWSYNIGDLNNSTDRNNICKKVPPAVSIRNDGTDYLVEMAHKYSHQIKLAAV